MPSRPDDRRAVDGASSTLARDIERIWRNWKAFIAEKQDEIATQQADESPEADLTGGPRATPRKAKLDAATRQQFGAVLEARRQQAQAKAEREAREQSRPAPDADQVYTALLAHIQRELDGQIHPSGMALVWYKDALIKFDAHAIAAGTTDADYLAGGAGAGPTKQQAALVLGALVVLIAALIVAVQWAFAAPPTTASTTGDIAHIGQLQTTLWTVDTAEIGRLVVPATMRSGYPLRLCIDEAAGKAATPGTTVVLTSTQAIRRYQVQSVSPNGAADLLLADCGSTPPVTKAAAQLLETRTRAMLASEALRGVTVRGPDVDPQAIPGGQMEITLDVTIPDAGGGTLILADGRRWSATRSMAEDGGTRLIYLVPLATAAQSAGWELPSGTGLAQLLPLTLAAPTSRAALLRRVLEVQASAPTVALRDGAPELALTLTLTLNPDAAPLALQADDLAATTEGSPATPRWDAPALTPGTPATVAVRIPISDRRTLELALAAWRARFTQPE